MLCYLPPLPAWNAVNRLRHLCHDKTIARVPPCLRVAHPVEFGTMKDTKNIQDYRGKEVIVVGARTVQRRGYTVLYLEVDDDAKEMAMEVRREWKEVNGKDDDVENGSNNGWKDKKTDSQKFVPSLILGHFTCSDEASTYRSAVNLELSRIGGISFTPSSLALLVRRVENEPFRILAINDGGGEVRVYDIDGDEGEMVDMPPDVGDRMEGGKNKRRKKKTWGN